MGRRSKVDLLGLVERILELYNKEQKTIKEIEEILQDEGYDISREAIRRKLKSTKDIAELYKKSMEEAKVLIDAVRENPNTDVIEVTTSLLARNIMNFTKDIDSIDFDDPLKFIEAVRKLSDAQVRVSKLRLDYQKGFEAAKKEIMHTLSLELAKTPDIKERLIQMIDRIELPTSAIGVRQ
jgi:predicted nucleic acid-binding protein